MTPNDHPMTNERQRIDKWLWHARIVKTRTLATKLARSGKIRVNTRKSTSASLLLCAGDVLTIRLSSQNMVLEVVKFLERRASSPVAQTSYNDLSRPSPAGLAKSGGARPTKKQRRQLSAFNPKSC